MTTSPRLTLCVVLALGACCLTVSAKTDQQSHALVAKADESRALATVKFEPFTIFSKGYLNPTNHPNPSHAAPITHTRHKCLVPNAFTHSLRSLAHLNSHRVGGRDRHC